MSDVPLIPGNETDPVPPPVDCLTARYLPFSYEKCSQPLSNFLYRDLALEVEEAFSPSDAE